MPEPYRLWYNKASMDPNQQGQSNAGAPSASNSGANIPAAGASTPSAGTPAAGTPPPVFSGAGAQVPRASVTPGSTTPATPTATPAGSSARRFFGASNRPGSAASAGQPASGIYSGNPTPGIITSAPAASGAAGGKKLSKGMIVGLIVIAILAIAAVVVGVIAATGGNRSSESESSQSAPVNMSELKTAYNNLANYIAFGDENKSEIKNNNETYTQHDMLEMALSDGFYPYPILEADIKLDEASSGAKKAYFSGLEQFYSQLPEGLTEGYGINVSDIYDYYHGFSNISMVSLDQIVSRYKTEGLEPTRNYLNNYVVSNSDKKDIRRYTDYLREYYIAFLNLVDDVKVNRGCEVNPNDINSCNISLVASYDDFINAQKTMETGAAYKIKATRQSASTRALLDIYNLANNESEGNS